MGPGLGRFNLRVTHNCIMALAHCKASRLYQSRVNLRMVFRRKVVTKDVSIMGGCALCDGRLAFSPWPELDLHWHINCLEMMPVFQALKAFLPDLRRHHVLVNSDNMIVVALPMTEPVTLQPHG